MMSRQSLLSVAVAALIVVGPASAADLAPQPAAYEAGLVPEPYDWSGFYIGANGGYAFGKSALVLSPSPNFITISPQLFDFLASNGSTSLSPTGFNVGLQGGYKQQFNAFVLGAEADWSYLGLSKSTTTGALPLPVGGNTTVSFSQSASMTQMATLRGIVGVPFGSFLPYVTGGLGVGWDRFAQTVQVLTLPGCVCWSDQASKTQIGWVVGAGVEYALSPKVSIKAEYLYADLGSLNFTTRGAPNGFPGLDFNHSARFTNQTLKAGLNFRLW
jgi:outer membrane immunogenic protein